MILFFIPGVLTPTLQRLSDALEAASAEPQPGDASLDWEKKLRGKTRDKTNFSESEELAVRGACQVIAKDFLVARGIASADPRHRTAEILEDLQNCFYARTRRVASSMHLGATEIVHGLMQVTRYLRMLPPLITPERDGWHTADVEFFERSLRITLLIRETAEMDEDSEPWVELLDDVVSLHRSVETVPYEIPLDQIPDTAALAKWCQCLEFKRWVTPGLLDSFARAVCGRKGWERYDFSTDLSQEVV